VERLLDTLFQLVFDWLMRARPGTWSHRLADKLKQRATRFLTDAGNVGEFEDLSEHEKMLADRVRVDTYARGIRTHIRPGDVVVDLGTGTGILAMLAARVAKHVYALDHSAVIDVARHIARANGVTNVEFIRTNSRKFMPAEKVDVILYEQIGDELFDENMVENVSDLRDRILKPSGRIVPDQFELYLEPVKLSDPWSVPFAWQMQLHGIDFGCVRSLAQGSGGLPRRWDIRWMNPLEVDHLLCEPEPICRLDLSKARVADLPTSLEASRRVTRAGRLDGLMLYVKVIFDDQIWFDTSRETLAPSWGNRLFRFPVRELAVGDELRIRVRMPDVRIVKGWQIELD